MGIFDVSATYVVFSPHIYFDFEEGVSSGKARPDGKDSRSTGRNGNILHKGLVQAPGLAPVPGKLLFYSIIAPWEHLIHGLYIYVEFRSMSSNVNSSIGRKKREGFLLLIDGSRTCDEIASYLRVGFQDPCFTKLKVHPRAIRANTTSISIRCIPGRSM